jgi:hypothetical protein
MTATSQSDCMTELPAGPLDIEGAWRGADLAPHPERWTYRLNEAEIAEIDAAIGAVRRAGTALDRISPASFPLPTLRPRLERALDRRILNGLGFWLVRGLPVDRYTVEEEAIDYLGIGSQFGSLR